MRMHDRRSAPAVLCVCTIGGVLNALSLEKAVEKREMKGKRFSLQETGESEDVGRWQCRRRLKRA